MYLRVVQHNMIFRKLFIINILLLFCGYVKAQLVVNPTFAATAVNNNLLGGGIIASNITYTGPASGLNLFTATNSNLGLTSGVLLTTGDGSIAIGPNENPGAGADDGILFTPDGDLDLSLLLLAQGSADTSTNDAAVLQFDFIPTSDTLKFRYVFASEEYLEFVGSGFNDAFAFFLTGISTPLPQTNIALIPGTSTPVSINNVNDVSFSQYYVDNGSGDPFFDPPPNPTIQYDGFTTALTAKYPVICGETYRIKLVVADVGDGILDSGVFLEAGSFTSSGGIEIIPDVSYSTTNDTLMYEGCGNALVNFVRTGNSGIAQTINYTIGGTATNGTDFLNLSGTLTFPAGVDTVPVNIDPMADGIAEGSETLILTVTSTICGNTTTSSVTIYIQDVNPITVNAGPDLSTACASGGQLSNTAVASGGVQPYTYAWLTGETTANITFAAPLVQSTYTVTATDACGNTASDNFTVFIEQLTPITLSLTPDQQICSGESVTLQATYTGGNGTVTISWGDGNTDATRTVSPAVTTTYTVTVTDVCGQTQTASVTISVSQSIADFDFFQITNNTFGFINNSVGYDVNLEWDFGDSTTSNEFEPNKVYTEDGVYFITLVTENADGCRDTMVASVVVRPDYFFYIPNAFTDDNNTLNEDFRPFGIGFDSYQMDIFNRWGETVFTTRNIEVGWDGLVRGNKAQDGVYVYRIKVWITNDQDPIIYSGKVTLLR